MNSPTEAIDHPTLNSQLQALGQWLRSDHTPMGELARLRRMHADDAQAVLGVLRMVLGESALYRPAPHLQRWALIVHSLALARGRHRNGAQSFSKALVELHFGEARLQQLLRADEELLFELLPRIARRIASKAVEADWRPIVRLVLNAGPHRLDGPWQPDPNRAQEARLKIARDFVIASSAKPADR